MSSFLERLQHACTLNNAGASLLAANDPSKAVKALKNALVVMEGLSKEESSEDFVMSDATAAKYDHCLSLKVPSLEDTFFIFNRAILLDAASIDIDLAFSNAAILFNLALTFHMGGKARCQAPKLQRAVHLYGLSIKLLDAMPVCGASSALALAALNNQAQIQSDLFQFEASQECLEQVRELLQYIPMPEPATAQDSTFLPLVTGEDMDEIYLNVAISAFPMTAPSA